MLTKRITMRQTRKTLHLHAADSQRSRPRTAYLQECRGQVHVARLHGECRPRAGADLERRGLGGAPAPPGSAPVEPPINALLQALKGYSY